MLPNGFHTKRQRTRTPHDVSSILKNKTGHKIVYGSLSMMLALLVGVVPQAQADHHLGGSLQFTQPEYKISENAGSVTVQVERRGGSQGSVAINYATVSLTAIPDKDYQPVYGGLMWGDGEISSKPFTIPIYDDGEVDAVKEISFFVTLLDTVASMTTATARPVLEQNTRAKIIIVDNDVVVVPPPTPTIPPVVTDPNTPPTTPTTPTDPTRPHSLNELFCAGLNLPSALERGIGKRICTKNPFKPLLREKVTPEQALDALLTSYTPEQFRADFSDCEPTSATERGLFEDETGLYVIRMKDDTYCRIDICPTLSPSLQEALAPIEEVSCGVVSKGERPFIVNPFVEKCEVPDKNCSEDLDGDGLKDCVVCANGEEQMGFGLE